MFQNIRLLLYNYYYTNYYTIYINYYYLLIIIQNIRLYIIQFQMGICTYIYYKFDRLN